MKNDSPVRMRLPAPISLPNSPPPWLFASSVVIMRMSSCMYIMPPASAITGCSAAESHAAITASAITSARPVARSRYP